MPIQYVKRFQMIFDFTKKSPPPCALPDGFCWLPWQADRLVPHARVKYESFRDSMDATLFPTFSQYDRCLRLMEAIASNSTFEPKATLLIAHRQDDGMLRPMAGIQGMKLDDACGAIQNVGVLPDYRRRGFGRLLVSGCLLGFREAGVRKVSLEVTADNHPAIRLYSDLGFETLKVVFKETHTA